MQLTSLNLSLNAMTFPVESDIGHTKPTLTSINLLSDADIEIYTSKLILLRTVHEVNNTHLTVRTSLSVCLCS